MNIKKTLICFFFLMLYFIPISTAHSQNLIIENGLSWLANNQNQTGSWGNADNSLNPLPTEYFAFVAEIK
jgi:hypothetical protein